MENIHAVIFTAELKENLDGYDAMIQRMHTLVEAQPGYLGMENVTQDQREITVSYWRSLDDIRAWKAQPEHLQAQEMGRRLWYRRYKVEVASITRKYEFSG